jgi:hypothetical protein
MGDPDLKNGRGLRARTLALYLDDDRAVTW